MLGFSSDLTESGYDAARMTALSKSAVVCALKNRASSFANRKRGGEAATQTAPFASIGGSSSAVREMRQFVNEDVLDEGDVRRSRPRVLGFGWPMASRLRGEESAIASAWTEPGLVGVAPLEVRGLARLCALPYRACAAHVRTCSSLDPVPTSLLWSRPLLDCRRPQLGTGTRFARLCAPPLGTCTRFARSCAPPLGTFASLAR